MKKNIGTHDDVLGKKKEKNKVVGGYECAEKKIRQQFIAQADIVFL